LSTRYKHLDKALDQPYWKLGQYMIIKLKQDNDILLIA
jgi:hypothetical protein